MTKNLKDTLLLPHTEMPIQANLPQKEQAVYATWGNIYQKFKRGGKNPFILHDGPPYANGNIHVGHALNKILKDFIVKFHYFNGQAVEFVPGWDCHGLPIEKEAKKTKPTNLRQACREYASQQITKQKEQFQSLGIIADWQNPYLTMSKDYEANTLRALYQLAQKGLLFEGLKPVFWSWAERTALAEAEVEYLDRTDTSVYVVFPSVNQNQPGMLVWTTTPWTLPANVAVAINPEIKYSEVVAHGNRVLVAENLVSTLAEKGVLEKSTAIAQPRKLWYGNLKHPFDNSEVPVVTADFVSDQEGTGCVHIAPAHGIDDYHLAIQNHLPIKCIVGPDGKYTEGKYVGVNVLEANSKILEDLKHRGLNLKEEQITHSYPHCWRSGKPVIFRATKQWFLNLDKFRHQVLEEFQKVQFFPEVSVNRMKPMLENRPDWCLSRQREWGVPIAFSKYESGTIVLEEEVVERTIEAIKQEGVDCWWKLTGTETTDILDVWFDSGYSWHILGDRQADLYLEGSDQHRGWFQSSLWLSVALANRAPYKKVITHGFVVDGNGKKMAKSEGNVINPLDVVKKYGAEVLRYWVATRDYTKDVSINDEILQRAQEGHRKLRNTLRFLVANTNDYNRLEEWRLLPIDSWIVNKTSDILEEVYLCFSEYVFYQGLQKLTDFINNDLSGIYMNSVKDRLYCDSKSSLKRRGAVHVLAKILERILPTIAPLFTYTAQEVFGYAPQWLKNTYTDIFEMQMKKIFPRYVTIGWSETYWKESLAKFHEVFDRLKREDKVKDTLEIGLESKYQFEGIADWFVVGYVSPFTDCKALAEWEGFRVVKSPYNKCIRCWKRNTKGEACSRCSVFEYDKIWKIDD